MPPRVYRGKSAYEFRPQGGGAIRLCDIDASQAKVWQRFEEERNRINKRAGIVGDLIDAFFESQDFRALSVTTQRDYHKYARMLLKVFGEVDAKSVKPEHIRRYMDLRGEHSRVQANRERSLLARLYQWAYERGRVSFNPCKDVRRFTERPRERYVTDEEYAAMYEAATLRLKVAMEIAYLCAARKSDVLKITRQDLVEEGIYIRQCKTGKKQIKRWTPRLRAAVALAEKQPSEIASLFLLHDGHGTPWSQSAVANAWRRAKHRAEANLGRKIDFTFHDLKAKGISDYSGDKQRFSGHRTPAQVAVYDRKPEIVDSLDLDVEN